jgi:hypothetical protein
MKIFLILFFSMLSLVRAAVPFQLPDPQMDHFLQGSWRAIVTAQVNTGKSMETVHTMYDVSYFSNHTFKATISYASSTGTMVTVEEGTWSIAEGQLSVIYTSISHPQYDSLQFDLLGNGQMISPFKDTTALPPPVTFTIHFLNKNRIQNEEGTVFYRMANTDA